MENCRLKWWQCSHGVRLYFMIMLGEPGAVQERVKGPGAGSNSTSIEVLRWDLL